MANGKKVNVCALENLILPPIGTKLKCPLPIWPKFHCMQNPIFIFQRPTAQRRARGRARLPPSGTARSALEVERTASAFHFAHKFGRRAGPARFACKMICTEVVGTRRGLVRTASVLHFARKSCRPKSERHGAARSRAAYRGGERARRSESTYAQLVDMMSRIVAHNRLSDGSLENATCARGTDRAKLSASRGKSRLFSRFSSVSRVH